MNHLLASNPKRLLPKENGNFYYDTSSRCTCKTKSPAVLLAGLCSLRFYYLIWTANTEAASVSTKKTTAATFVILAKTASKVRPLFLSR